MYRPGDGFTLSRLDDFPDPRHHPASPSSRPRARRWPGCRAAADTLSVRAVAHRRGATGAAV